MVVYSPTTQIGSTNLEVRGRTHRKDSLIYLYPNTIKLGSCDSDNSRGEDKGRRDSRSRSVVF